MFSSLGFLFCFILSEAIKPAICPICNTTGCNLVVPLTRFETEIDLIQHSSLRDAFRYSKLIGTNDDEESLREYSNKLFVRFIEEQLIYFPNSRQIIDSWIQITGDLFDDVILNGNIPITEMLSVPEMKIFDYKFFKAVDGSKLTVTDEITKIFAGNDFGNRRGVVGCALSHYRL